MPKHVTRKMWLKRLRAVKNNVFTLPSKTTKCGTSSMESWCLFTAEIPRTQIIYFFP